MGDPLADACERAYAGEAATADDQEVGLLGSGDKRAHRLAVVPLQLVDCSQPLDVERLSAFRCERAQVGTKPFGERGRGLGGLE